MCSSKTTATKTLAVVMVGSTILSVAVGYILEPAQAGIRKIVSVENSCKKP